MLLVVMLVGGLAALAPAARAAVDESIIPVKVQFTGSGTFSINETYLSADGVCTISTTDPMTLAWEADYTTVLTIERPGDTDKLQVSMAGTNGTLAGGPSTYSFASSGTGSSPVCGQVAARGFPACAGSIPLPGTPTLQASGGGDKPIEAKVQSLTQVGSATCSGLGGEVSVDRDLSVLATLLPDDLTAQVSIPPSALGTGAPYAVNINGGQPSADCTAAGHQATGTIGCADQLSWSGSVTFTPLCAHSADPKLPLCVKDQTKKLAADSASAIRRIGYSYSPPCPAGGNSAVCMAATGVGRSLILLQADAADEVAKDPPDSHYGVVARPSPPRLARLSLLRRRLPRVATWAKAYAGAIGYEKAFATAINRQSGALLAQHGGSAGASAALARQTAAAVADAGRAIASLGRAERLAGPAARELRRTLHVAFPRVGRPDRLMLRALRASSA